ncbi:MAG: alpha/beta hydrolase [Burkholderiales bacterium]
MTRQMTRAAIDGVELEYQQLGSGEPVVLVHAGIFSDFFAPLVEQPALAGRYRVLNYHRVGCAGSSRALGAVSLAQEALHCRLLMRHLGIESAHIVGHSNSGNLVLQLAMDSPTAVHSLVVAEPALMTVPSAQTARAFIGAAMQQYRAGDKAGAVDTFLKGTCGQNYRAVVDAALPGALARYAADADTFFAQQLPAMQQWSFGRDEASRITQPVLAVIGEGSQQLSPIWNERQELLLSWLPNAEPFVLPKATHLLQVENPRDMAEGLAAFFTRHPLST